MRGRWSRPIFGPFRRKAHTGVPADHFPPAKYLYGDGITVLVADGPALLEKPASPILQIAGALFSVSKGALTAAFAGPGLADVHVCERPDDVSLDVEWTCDICAEVWPPIPEHLLRHPSMGVLAAGLRDAAGARVFVAELDDQDNDPAVVAQALDAVIDALEMAHADETADSEAQEGDLIAAADVLVDKLIDMLGGIDADEIDEPAMVRYRAVKAGYALHDKMTGAHAHEHSHGDGTKHSHSHFHSDANVHNHSHAAAKMSRRDLHTMSVADRRRFDGENEITDEAALRALVSSAFTARGGIDVWTALRESKGLTAATNADGTIEAAAWHAYLCAEGIRTDDGRELLPMSCRWNDLPVSLRLLIEDEGGHWGAVTCGRIDSMERVEAQGLTMIAGAGVFGSDENGQLAELLVTEQTQRFVSIDPRDGTYEWVEVEIIVNGYDVEYDCWQRYSDLLIGAATIVAMPALQQAVITLESVALPDTPMAIEDAPPGLDELLPDDAAALVAGAGAPSGGPSPDFFENPIFGNGLAVSAFDNGGDARLVKQRDGSYACPLTISEPDENGWRQVFGHVAYWSAEHTGFPNGDPVTGKPVHPPHSPSGYAHYNNGACPCSDSECQHGVGQITMGCGHAALTKIKAGRQVALASHEVQAHYDGGYGAVQMADVMVGEDVFGPWFSGVLKPGLDDQQLRDFMAMGVSGDWREMGSTLDLLAVLSVPAAGFPIARRTFALAAAGAPIDDGATHSLIRGDKIVAMVAAGIVRRVPDGERIAALETQIDELMAIVRPMAVDAIRASVGL